MELGRCPDYQGADLQIHSTSASNPEPQTQGAEAAFVLFALEMPNVHGDAHFVPTPRKSNYPALFGDYVRHSMSMDGCAWEIQLRTREARVWT